MKNYRYFISIMAVCIIMLTVSIFYIQSSIFIAITVIVILGLFLFLNWQYHRNVEAKETEVQYREQLFGILANNTNDVFLMLSCPEYVVEYVSPNVERVLGISWEEVKTDYTVLGGALYSDGVFMGYETLNEMVLGETVVYESERIHKKTGEHRWFAESVYRTMVDDSERLIIVISDRTAERKSEDALKEALAIAKAANESKSAFLSNMSHDIRTPMNAIVGLATLLQRDAHNPEKVLEHTRKITASSQHLLGLINDVLDMSKIESGKTTLNIAEINLAEIIDGLGTIMRPQAKAKQQEFEILVYDIQTEHLLGDKLRINQILINIVSNAVKYTPIGGKIEVIVRQLPQVSKNYARLRFIVKDNGIGMSQEYLKEIYQPFSREDNSNTHMQGTGLGMAITKNLVELMGGTISVESTKGVGSTFTVELELRIQKREAERDFWKNHGITNMLIVDDEEEICTGIQNAMTGTGVTVKSALDGNLAVQMVESTQGTGEKFDLILIDWKMSEMDGVETTRRIREIVPSDIPILVLTAYDWSEIEEEGQDVGINGFLQKPFFLSNLQQAIKALNAQEETDNTLEEQESILNGKKFLIAEDIEINAEIIQELLDMYDVVCEVTKDGREVLEKFEQSKPGQYDAILMDIQMPIMNGYEATKAIRASNHPQAKTIPIIAMTANAFADDINDALNAGMNAHLAKPVNMEQLETVLEEILCI